jgi:hypothetical protein
MWGVGPPHIFFAGGVRVLYNGAMIRAKLFSGFGVVTINVNPST